MLKKRKQNYQKFNDSILENKGKKQKQVNNEDSQIPVKKKSDVDLKQLPKNDEKLDYSKFLQIFNPSHEQSINLMNSEAQIITKHPQIQFTQKQDSYDSYFNHYHQNNEYVNDIIEKKDEQKSKQSNNINKKLNDLLVKSNQKNEQDIYNNNIKIFDFQLKKEFKQKFIRKTPEFFPQLIIDKLALQSIEKFGIHGEIIKNKNKKVQNYIEKNPFQGKQLELQKIIQEYHDFIMVDPDEMEIDNFRQQWILHALNHIQKSDSNNENDADDNVEDDELKNKGFNRCKILILCPFKKDALEIITSMINIFSNSANDSEQHALHQLKKTSNKEKFLREFDDENAAMDDDFKLGISFNNKNIKLYAPFTNCDIILASPLSLKLVTGIKGQDSADYSFLSSLEILIIDRASSIYMQNWQNLLDIFDLCNIIPRHKDMTNNLNKIRPYFFENLSKFYRQNIIYTEMNFPELNQLRESYFQNYKGSIMNKPYYNQIIDNDRNFSAEFIKLDVQNFSDDAQKRFDHFKNKIWQKVQDDQSVNRTIIFCNSYFEYVKIRNYFKKQNAFVEFISEYTKPQDIQKRLSKFNKKDTPFILLSERAQFFNLCILKKMYNIIFYSPPKNSFIYKELIENLVDTQNDQLKGASFKNKVCCLFSKFDQIFIEKIVGTKNSLEFFQNYNKSAIFII